MKFVSVTVVFLLLSGSCYGQNLSFNVTGISGSWHSASGGVFSGLGTGTFVTGTPVDGSVSTRLSFGFNDRLARGVRFYEPFYLGGVLATNGRTLSGTTASNVRMLLHITAESNEISPTLEIQTVDNIQVNIWNSPNLTGDPGKDSDAYWSSRFTNAIYVPEGGSGTAGLYGQLIPTTQAFSSGVGFEIVDFGDPVTGDAFLGANPIPEPTGIIAMLLLLAAGRRNRS